MNGLDPDGSDEIFHEKHLESHAGSGAKGSQSKSRRCPQQFGENSKTPDVLPVLLCILLDRVHP